MSSLGWKRLPMKVRFLVDQLSSLKQTSIGIAFVPIVDIRFCSVDFDSAAFAGIREVPVKGGA
jgi:hypothetical protein